MKNKFYWTARRASRLIRLKERGHRSYSRIARILGCTTAQACKAFNS